MTFSVSLYRFVEATSICSSLTQVGIKVSSPGNRSWDADPHVTDIEPSRFVLFGFSVINLSEQTNHKEEHYGEPIGQERESA